MNKRIIFVGLLASALTACAMTSDVMDTGNGTYLISARASPIRGGAAGANEVAYKDAQAFCAKKDPNLHAIVLNAADHDVYESSAGGSAGPNGAYFGASTNAAGETNLHFRCGK